MNIRATSHLLSKGVQDAAREDEQLPPPPPPGAAEAHKFGVRDGGERTTGPFTTGDERGVPQHVPTDEDTFEEECDRLGAETTQPSATVGTDSIG